MPVYVMLTRLTDNGAKTIKDNPGRILEVDGQIKDMGVTVLQQYAVLGEYDFVNIVEAADDMTVAKVAVELGSRGTLRIETLPAIPIDEFIAGFK
ncbi:MAG: GYD domain-containing protein [Coriobacteriia bacterium]